MCVPVIRNVAEIGDDITLCSVGVCWTGAQACYVVELW